MQYFLTGAIAAMAMTATAAAAQDWTVDLYGGGVLERSEEFNPGISEDLDSGTAFGATLYYSGLLDGVLIGVDVMRTSAELTEFANDFAETTSLMVVARYDIPVADNVAVYGSAGVGMIRSGLDEDGDKNFDNVAGGQVAAGLRYGVNGAFTAFGEIKYQTSFDEASLPDTSVDTLSYGATNILIGSSFGF